MKVRKISSIMMFFLLVLCLTFHWGCKKSVTVNDNIGVDDTSIYPDVPPPPYWPTAGWQSTTPEQQGMDSGKLADMLEYIQNLDQPIRSVLIVRKGYLVLEAYFHPFEKGLWHVIHSCTKSVLSALTGIAIQRGEIQDDRVNVLDFFSDYTPADNDDRKKAMQLKHLLTMTTGMNAQDSYLYDWEGLDGLRNSSNWAQYALDREMIHDPGTTFDYSNCASYLIAALVHKAVGQNGLDYGHEHLFSHLGMAVGDVYWPLSPQGVVYGWGQIRMKPVDMAKFGFLFLHKGRWDGTLVVSEQWVNKSTRQQVESGTLAEGYGYQWWTDSRGYFMALGYAGQLIIINPAEDLVVTINSVLDSSKYNEPEKIYLDYILASIISDNAIAEDAQKQARLNGILESISNPPAQPVPPMPAKAAEISGINFYFDTNQYNYIKVGLTFTPGSDEAQFKLSYRDRNLDLPLGLDDRYRTTFQSEYYRSYKGRWLDDDTFLIDYHITDHSEWGTLRLSFSGNSVTFTVTNNHSGNSFIVTGTPR